MFSRVFFFGNESYPCGKISYLLASPITIIIGESILWYLVVNVIFYFLMRFAINNALRIIGKIAIFLLWTIIFVATVFYSYSTGPSLEPSFDIIFPIITFYQLLTFLFITFLILFTILKFFHAKKIIKIIVILISVILLSTQFQLFLEPNAIIDEASSLINSIIYPPPNLGSETSLSNFNEEPLIDQSTGKYRGIVLHFDIAVKNAGEYWIDPEIITANLPNDNENFFIYEDSTPGINTSSYTMQAGETKSFTYIFHSDTVAGPTANGPYYVTVKVVKFLKTVNNVGAGDYNIAGIIYSGLASPQNEVYGNGYNVSNLIYLPTLKTRAYSVHEFENNGL